MNENKILLNGDCLEVLRKMRAESVDAIVCDPPYGLAFMGKKWDYDVPVMEIWKECLRVLKPGGHLLAFGGTRTYHRLVVAIEDAGFEIRDQIQWIYGQGFPKSQNIALAIDKQLGVESEVLGVSPSARPNHQVGNSGHQRLHDNDNEQSIAMLRAPTTDDAKKWSGWGTALKPANEPICLARKPLGEKTVAKNVLKHGTGGLNIDASRIATDWATDPTARGWQGKAGNGSNQCEGMGFKNPNNAGRFPANVIFDEDAAAILDGQSGFTKSDAGLRKGNKADTNFGQVKVSDRTTGYSDAGGASRFFYVAKASKSDRGAGNGHPTVKPIKLMEYLVKLITPEGGTVLDPFMGSGTTGVAALKNGFKFVGIEIDPSYFAIADGRMKDADQ